MEQEFSLLNKISGTAFSIKHILEKAETLQVTLKPEPSIEESKICNTSAEQCEENCTL